MTVGAYLLRLGQTHLNLLFNKGIYKFKQEDLEKGKAYCEQAISLCDILQQTERGLMYTNRYHSWLTQRNNPDFKEITIEPGILGFKLDSSKMKATGI